MTENNPENDNKDDNTENTPSDNNGANTGNTDKTSGNNPQTGDNIVLYIIILLVSSMGIIFTTKIRKK